MSQSIGAEWSGQYAKKKIGKDALEAFEHLESTVTKVVSTMDSLKTDLKGRKE